MSPDAHALSRDGYVKIGAVLDADEIRRLQAATAALLVSQPAVPYADYQAHHKHNPAYEPRVYANRDWTIGTDIVGASAEFDALMAKIMTDPRVRATIEGVIGKDYKMWQLNIRRHEPGSEGQPLHQDEPGGLGLSILIDDTPELDGATVFIRGSHRWPINYSDVIMKLRPRMLKPLLAGATGRAGDVSFFFNRTWHGRFPGDHSRTAILLSVFAVGTKFPMHAASAPVLERVDPELRRLLDPTNGVRPLTGVDVVVTSDKGETPPTSRDLQYALYGVQTTPFTSPWKIVRTIGQAKRLAVKAVGRERLNRLRSLLTARAPG